MADDKPKSREELLAAIKAKADALRAARATAGGPQATKPAEASAVAETPVSAINAAGRPAVKPQNPKIRAYGMVNQAVEITSDKSEEENLKKLLGGLGAYANPLRGGAWELSYRYYAEARRRLAQAGYEIEETDYAGRPLTAWTPQTRGWTRVQDS